MSFLRDLIGGEYKLGEGIDLEELAALYDCPQEEAVHGEGSVGRHTEMVLEATEEILKGEPGLDPTIARLAAVFHDVGKPATTRQTSNGRWAAPDHHLAGFWMLGPLFDTNPDLAALGRETKTAVRTLVREHLWAYQIERVSRGAAIRASHLVDPRHAYALWRADTQGRISYDQERLAETVEYAWGMMGEMGAQEPGARPYEAEVCEMLGRERLGAEVSAELLRGVVRDQINSVGQAMAYAAEREKRGEGQLIYTVGLPGVGKTTFATKYAEETGAVRLSQDAARRRDRAKLASENWRQLEGLLRGGKTVIVDATHIERRQRDPLIAVAARQRAEVVAVIFEAGLGYSVAAQQGRVEAVPREAIVRMAENFRYPTPDEYARSVVVAEGDSPVQRVARVLGK